MDKNRGKINEPHRLDKKNLLIRGIKVDYE
jgi:hypothetical protein